MATRVVECQKCGHKNIAKLSNCRSCDAPLNPESDSAIYRPMPAKATSHEPEEEVVPEEGQIWAGSSRQALGSDSKTKRCPYCAEEILSAAIKCKHCGSELKVGPGRPSGHPYDGRPTADSTASPVGPVGSNSGVDYSLFLLALPVLGTMLFVFWIPNMRLIDGPGSKIQLIAATVVMGTAVIAAIEAGALGMVRDKNRGTYSPITWFFALILVWFIAYPWYMSSREKFVEGKRFALALICTLLFVLSGGFIISAVDAQQEKLQRDLNAIQRELDRFSQ